MSLNTPHLGSSFFCCIGALARGDQRTVRSEDCKERRNAATGQYCGSEAFYNLVYDTVFWFRCSFSIRVVVVVTSQPRVLYRWLRLLWGSRYGGHLRPGVLEFFLSFSFSDFSLVLFCLDLSGILFSYQVCSPQRLYLFEATSLTNFISF